MEQRGFTGAGRADDGQEIALRDIQADAAQGGNIDVADTVDLAKIADTDDGLGHSGPYS